MRGNERGHVSIPTAKQNCRAAIIRLGQTEPAVFLWNFDSKRADLSEPFEILRWNFTGAIDLIGIDMIAQIGFQFAEEIFASGAIFSALRRIRIDSVKI